MKVATYHGPGRRHWADVADPVLRDSEDAVIRVDAVTICGTDLHILRGDVPTCESGRVLTPARPHSVLCVIGMAHAVLVSPHGGC